MKFISNLFTTLIVFTVFCFSAQAQTESCIPVTGISAYIENFDSLANSGTANTSMPLGFSFKEYSNQPVNQPANDQKYAANNATLTAENAYSYFGAPNNELAFGGVEGSLQSKLTLSACYINNSPYPFSSVQVLYYGEQWFVGGDTADTITFEYTTSQAATPNTGSYTSVPQLKFTSPILNSRPTILDGNDALNRYARNFTIQGLSIPVGNKFRLRWTFPAKTNFHDDGLAVDDVQVTVSAPTDATCVITGRVFSPEGLRAVPKAQVSVTDSNGFTRTVITNSFGYYRLENVSTGRLSIISVKDKRYSFASQNVTPSEDQVVLDFYAQLITPKPNND